MKTPLKNLFLVAIMASNIYQPSIADGKTLLMVHRYSLITFFDEEYDKYKREGDELFKKGDYERAKKKYLACLEVPNFLNDIYAKGKIGQCDEAIGLRKQGEVLLTQNKGNEGVETLKKVLVINPEDPITRKLIADFWETEGNKRYANKLYNEAKSRYEESLKYTEKSETIRLQIQNCIDQIEQFEKPKYDLARKEGDAWFVSGNYEKALQKYKDCIALASFVNDNYALMKISQSTQAVNLRKNIKNALDQNLRSDNLQKDLEALFSLNPDPITRLQLLDFWQFKAGLNMGIQNFTEAKKSLEEALKYTFNDKNLQDKIKKDITTIEDKIKGTGVSAITETKKSETVVQKEPEKATVIPGIEDQKPTPVVPTNDPKRGLLPAIGVGLVGLGAGGYALMLNNQWNSKLAELNTITTTADPNNTGEIISKTNYDTYKAAYDDAKVFQSKQALRNICLGVAAGAILVEAYLLFRPKRTQKKVTVAPATQSYGLALQVKF